MKEIVRRIFGDEAANDPDIVAFYEDVQKIAMEEYHIEKSKKEAQERYDRAIDYISNQGGVNYSSRKDLSTFTTAFNIASGLTKEK